MANSPQPLSFPSDLSPSALDTLPVLSAILSRLQSPSSTSTGSPPSASPSQSVPGGSLAIKDIPGATDELKHKLRKARAQVKELPDIQRTLGEQEEEIRELEEKISRQRSVLKSLKEVGLKARMEKEGRNGDGGEVMEGVEN